MNSSRPNRRGFLRHSATLAVASLLHPVGPVQSAGDAKPVCYTDDWQRTRPDLAVYLPPKPLQRDGYNDHFQVDFTPKGDLLAIWTQATFEAARDLRVVCSRSEDGGRSWSPLQELA